MRFVKAILFCVFSLCLSYSSLAEGKKDSAAYYQIASQLSTEQHLPLFDTWLKQQTFSQQQQAVVNAIKAFNNQDAEQALAMLEPFLDSTELPEMHFWAGRVYGRMASQASVFKAPGLAKKTLKHFQRSVELDDSFVAGHNALVLYYIRAPFIAGGSVKKAGETADKIAKIDAIEGINAHIQIAISEEDSKTHAELVEELIAQLKTEYEKADSNKSKTQIASYYFSAAITQSQNEDFSSAREHFSTALAIITQANKENDDTEESNIAERLEHATTQNLQQAIHYQLGRLGVLSEQNITSSIAAMTTFIDGPEHPVYQEYWAKLRLAQLLYLDGQITSAKDYFGKLPDVDDDNFNSVKKTFAKQFK